MSSSKTYWMDDEAKVVANKLMQHHQTSDGWTTNPIAQTWVRNQIAYYSPVLEPDSWETALGFGGEQGELVKMVIPQARSLARQYIGITTKQKLAVQAVALNNEGSDLNGVLRLGNALGNRIVKNCDLDCKKIDLAEKTYIHGASYITATWRTDKGDPYAHDNETGSFLYEGDLDMSVYSVFDVLFDYSIENFEDRDWIELRTKKNRWDLAAQHPELKDEIMSLPACRETTGNNVNQYQSVSDEDMVYVYELYHRPTPAMPAGRMMMYSNDKTIYYDGENDYGCIPVEEFRPEKIQGTGFGFPQFSNLLPAQEMLDHECSTIATNHAAFGVQSITAPRDSAVGVQQLDGMNWISFTPQQGVSGGGRPEALQLTASSPESFKFAGELKSHLMELANINAALRGAPPPGVTSGAAIATLTTTAIESTTPFSDALLTCMEKAIEKGIKAYRAFAKVPRILEITGINFQTTNQEFIGTDLDPIRSMKISRINPVMLTSAGRSDLADKMLQSGLIKSPQKYMSILEGGAIEKLFDDELSENDLLDAERDMLMKGEKPIALITDDHPKHVMNVRKLLNDPRVRANSANIGLMLEFIEEHVALEKQKDPFLAAMLMTGKAPQGGPPQPGQKAPNAEQQPPDMPAMGTAQPAQPADDLLGRPA